MVDLLRIRRLPSLPEAQHVLISFILSLVSCAMSSSLVIASSSSPPILFYPLPSPPFPSPSRQLCPSSSFSFFFCHVQYLYSGSLAQVFLDLHNIFTNFLPNGRCYLSFLCQDLFSGEEIIGFLALLPSKQTHRKQANQQPLALKASFSPP